MEVRGEARLLRALFFVSLLLLLLEPGRVPLFEPDEGRYAEIPREMIASRDFVTPRLNGVLYFEKPPLHYWSVAGSFLLLGESELASRLPTKLASFGLAVAALLFARKRWGEGAGWLAGLLAASGLLVFALAHINLIDPSVSLAIALAGFSFAAFQEKEASGDARAARRALYGLHVSCAAAVMLKGLIGIVLPGGAIVVFVLVTSRYRLLPKLFSPGPLLAFLALTVPWHVLVARRNPDFLSFYFVHEHLQRFATKGARRTGSPLYFVAVLVAGFLPWTAFFGRLARAWPGRTLTALRARGTETFLWIFSVLIFLFFSVSQSKLVPYLEPIWPAVAVLLALGIERAREAGATFTADRRLAAFFFGALFAGALAYGWGAGYVKRFGVETPALLLSAGLAAGLVASLWPRPGAPIARIAIPWLVFLAGASLAFPAIARAITPWRLVERTLAELGPEDALVQRGHYLEVPPFYTKRLTPIGRLGWSELDFGRAREHADGLFPTDPEFAALWNGERRVLCIAHRDALGDFARPPIGLRPPVILAVEGNGKHVLIANR